MINPLLQDYVNKRMNQPTVILSFRILLNNHYVNGIDASMTKTQIENEFNQVHEQYGIATFRRDYVLRQCGHDENAIDQTADLFYIKPNFLDGMNPDDYIALMEQIDNHWVNFQTQQQQLISEIEQLKDAGSLDDKKQYIVNMITSREAVKRGQAFEVASFAVLRTYLYSLGFDLNRFSTTYSNDGGIDFVAQNAVYQVTTKLSERKFEEDIKKVTGKPRVIVYKDTVQDFNTDNFQHELVINNISKTELCKMLDYLVEKKGNHYLDIVLSTMIEEFNREFYQNAEN